MSRRSLTTAAAPARALGPAVALTGLSQPLEARQHEADAQQALIDLFPHLRHEAYNALRELFPTPASAHR